MNAGKKYFCSNPFNVVVINQAYDLYMCCEAWLPKPIGNVRAGSAKDAWNSPAAREIRESILDGSFRFCTCCPFLEDKKSPVQRVDRVTDPRLLDIMEKQAVILDSGPLNLNLAHDRSCNLKCPSCRKEAVQTKASNFIEYQEKKLIQEKILYDLKDSLRELYVSGSGDPFGSQLFHEMLMGMKQKDYPHLKLFLHSNGQLFNRKNWDSIRGINQAVKMVQISIDAANAKTYQENRNSSWERLNGNLEFIAGLRQEGRLEYFAVNMVVQRNNWREMLEFIDLGRKYHADNVSFLALQNWGTYTESEYNRQAVHLESHPEHQAMAQFLAGASQPRDIDVYWGLFARYVNGGPAIS
jgi:MoaA/NifB/PqqE/SkfB family radical SAM enzyme